eukprot:CAMPEP_0184392646 /NCGR_PEP_ID=MMETSP0007-20130409/29235_1 /TAXON_ID=97485 /ORGANISM="Prymnesium parvum, Strain Texoma1" /LENGTH=65 /DNA_ID=CAMNT_0026743303 /DNA_START=107 /DNA_END=301 /DNA_ORIENTATION=+
MYERIAKLCQGNYASVPGGQLFRIDLAERIKVFDDSLAVLSPVCGHHRPCGGLRVSLYGNAALLL